MQGGFLFTTVASCLQWPGTQNGHWSATAFFYACMLFAFVAIVMGSQQLLVLPNERPHYSDEDFETSSALDSKERCDRKLKESEERYQQAVIKRLRDTRYDDRPNSFLVFALQAPMMLLTLSVMAFLAGLCSVIFAPLANSPVWDDKAKVCVDTPIFKNDMPTCGHRSLLHSAYQVFCALLFSALPHPWCTDCSAWNSTKNPRCSRWSNAYRARHRLKQRCSNSFQVAN